VNNLTSVLTRDQAIDIFIATVMPKQDLSGIIKTNVILNFGNPDSMRIGLNGMRTV